MGHPYTAKFVLFDEAQLNIQPTASIEALKDSLYDPPCVRVVVRCSTFLYFSGGRDRMMIWDTHQNVRRPC